MNSTVKTVKMELVYVVYADLGGECTSYGAHADRIEARRMAASFRRAFGCAAVVQPEYHATGVCGFSLEFPYSTK